MKKKYYVTRTNDNTGGVSYMKDRYSGTFVHARFKETCPQFSHKGAKRIANTMNAKSNGWFKYDIEEVVAE